MLTPAPLMSRAAAPAALLAALLAVVASVRAVAVHLSTPIDDRIALLATPEVTVGPVAAAVGAVLLRHAAARVPGLLLLLVGVSASTYGLAGAVAARDGGDLATWLAAWTWAPAFLPFALVLPLLFPDGQLPSRRWRPVLVAAVVLTATTCVGAAVDPGQVSGLDGAVNPLGVSALEPAVEVLQAVFLLGTPVLAALAVASLVVRFRAAAPAERRQLGWFAYALTVAVVASFVAPPVLVHAAAVAVPLAVLVAVVRYRLYDIDVLVRRTVVSAVLLGGAAVVYAAVVGWTSALLRTDGQVASFAGAVAVALAFAPAQARVRRGVDRLLFGERADPYRLLTAVDERVRAAGSPAAALVDAVDAVATGLRLPGVAVEVDLPDGRTVREQVGRLTGSATTVELAWQGRTVGRLTASPRSGEQVLGELDARLLADLAGPVAALGSALGLGADLARSREQAVSAREEERRRVRRDLHDGLGPQLAGVVMMLDAAGNAVGRDDERARSLLGTARQQAEDAVVDVRRLVHGLRPPALDDLGLVGALRAGAAGPGPQVEVEVVGELSGLPAALEVAAYRITQESLLNAAKHGRATRAVVRLAATADEVLLEVSDDGVGIAPGAGGGVGLASMRERAAELGGTCSVVAQPDGGTLVTARLPVQRTAT